MKTTNDENFPNHLFKFKSFHPKFKFHFTSNSPNDVSLVIKTTNDTDKWYPNDHARTATQSKADLAESSFFEANVTNEWSIARILIDLLPRDVLWSEKTATRVPRTTLTRIIGIFTCFLRWIRLFFFVFVIDYSGCNEAKGEKTTRSFGFLTKSTLKCNVTNRIAW